MIKIYSTPTCSYCKTLKEYLKKCDIEFEDIDVSKDDKQLDEMIKISGQMSTPVININDTIICGFDKNRIDALLNIK